MEGMFLPVWERLPGPGRQQNEHLFGSSFYGNNAMIRVFRSFAWFSSISGTRIMAHKPSFGKKSKRCRKSV